MDPTCGGRSLVQSSQAIMVLQVRCDGWQLIANTPSHPSPATLETQVLLERNHHLLETHSAVNLDQSSLV